MNILEPLIGPALKVVPMALVILIGGGSLWVLSRSMVRQAKELRGEGTFRRQLVLSILGIVFLVALIIAAPLDPDDTHDLITLFGVAFTGVIALSSATIASNMMAGFMLRMIRNFKRGDYIHVGEFLGRVTERGLFHTEIQNERSDLVTLPNLYLASNAMTVIRPSGTFVSAALSLGYDLQHDDVEGLLIEAAENAGLVEPFVRIRELGDFSVSYEVTGQLRDTKKFLGSKSVLRRSVLDTLHSNGVEIVSPTFMNQRQLGKEQIFVPEIDAEGAKDPRRSRSPDTVVFDKADQVEKVEDLRNRLAALDEEIAGLEENVKKLSKTEEGSAEADQLAETIYLRQRIRERVMNRIASLEEAVKEG